MISQYKKYAFLLEQLVSRDFKSKYKRSVLGVFWSLLYPLATMLVLDVVFSRMFRMNIDHYPIYLFSGLVLFNYFSETIGQGMTGIVQNAQIIKKIYIPKMIFPLSKAISSSINLGVSVLVLLLLSVIGGITPWWTWLLVPFPMVCVLIFALGFSLVMSACMVYLRDLQYLWGIINMIWMYMTPIIYPIKLIPQNLQFLFRFNPMYHYIGYMRDLILYHNVPNLTTHLACLGSALVMLVFGIWTFRKLQDNFILYL